MPLSDVIKEAVTEALASRNIGKFVKFMEDFELRHGVKVDPEHFLMLIMAMNWAKRHKPDGTHFEANVNSFTKYTLRLINERERV